MNTNMDKQQLNRETCGDTSKCSNSGGNACSKSHGKIIGSVNETNDAKMKCETTDEFLNSTTAGKNVITSKVVDMALQRKETERRADEFTFKISSTEDNYVQNIYKSKARQGMYSKHDHPLSDSRLKKYSSSTNACTKHSRSRSHDSSLSLDSSTESVNKEYGRDFISRHRRRMARLKRLFFESHTSPKPLPVPIHNICQQSPASESVPTETDEQTFENKMNTSGSTKELVSAMENIHETQLTSKVGYDLETIEGHDLETLEKAAQEHNLDTQNATPCRLEERTLNTKPCPLEERRRHRSAGDAVEPTRSSSLIWASPAWATSSEEFSVVIAIDFGTTYSGYAYSFVHEPDIIHLMRRHESGEPGLFDQKIPTTILLTPEGQFHSFGYAAREHYYDIDPKDSLKWMYFDRFKMLLHQSGELRQDAMLRTSTGKEASAMKIFAYSLAYFKDLAIQEIMDQSLMRITSDVIRWVITVPAIWKASAKQFMRQAAYEAGIVTRDSPDRLLISLEPEAASIYCRRLRIFQMLSADETYRKLGETINASRASSRSLPELSSTEICMVPNDLEQGTRYMVVDCGGGTVDITVHEIVAGGKLKELHRATGGAHGSVGVDEEFETLLGAIFGPDLLLQFKRKKPTVWVELMAIFESRKRTASPYRSSSISVTLPYAFIDFVKKCRGCSVETAIRKYGDLDITVTANGTLRLSPIVMRRLFLPTVDRIKQAIGDVLNNRRLSDVTYMFLAGGFAESSIIQHEMRKDFGALMKIIIPPGVAMAVLKGAVCFGMDPHIVNSRCSCLTYGVGVLHRFNEKIHPEEKRVTKDNVHWCTDVFDTFVKVNQSVELGECIVRRYTPVRRTQTATTINIYCTDQPHVGFITEEGVRMCGTLTLRLGDDVPDGQRRELRTEMMFGDTEIRVRATDVLDGRSVEAIVDFINY
ncbi:heat shock 70 kDa protein 12A-like [Dreissena polymorpha]|nr:heat shock 70 kDa protein 12A-like [Dreissena polymorpha]